MPSLRYPVLCCTVRLPERKQALLLSSQAECCAWGLSDGALGAQSVWWCCQTKHHQVWGWAQRWACPRHGALPAAALATRSPLVAEQVQQCCSVGDHAGAQMAPWFPSVQVSSPHPPLSPCSQPLLSLPYPHISSCFHSQYTSVLMVVSGESRPSILQTFYKKRVHFA